PLCRFVAPNDRLARPSWRSVWRQLRRAFPFALTGLVANIQARMAPLVLGYFSSAGELALFAVASRIGRGVRILPQATLTAAMPVFSREILRAQPDSAR